MVDETKSIDQIPEWFTGSRLNFAENILRYQDNHLAVIYESEYEKDTRKLTYAELYQQVIRVQAALKSSLQLKVGDIIAAYAANVPEVLIFMLAAVSLGCIFTTIPPEFGVAAAHDRLRQTLPKLLLVSETVYYNGKIHDQISKVVEVAHELDNLEVIVVLPSSFSIDPDAVNSKPHSNGTINGLGGVKLKNFEQFLSQATMIPSKLEFVQLPFNHPLYILYSSGTTGAPKCLIHSAGGTLIQHLKEHYIHGDLNRSDVFIQYTTIGWMMWHWLISALATGCAIVLYEGSPFRPHRDQLLKLVDRHRITRLGVSAKYIQHLQESNYDTVQAGLELVSLKTIYSTGSPLSPSNFRFIYDHIKSNLQVASITGGTDIISLFGAPNPILSVYAGEIQCAGLGMDIVAWDGQGHDVTSTGEAGDLVCRRPFPSMPIYFLHDEDGCKYRAAYFNHFPGVWHHGDFVQFNPRTGGLIMLGRSDGTLNPAGVRFGSAELYNALSNFAEEVEDSLVVGVRGPGETDEQVFMFIKPTGERDQLEEDLVQRIKIHIRKTLSPRHVPAQILYTPAVPYTLNGKKVEVAVKRILSRQPTVSLTGLSNPESLDYYRNLQL